MYNTIIMKKRAIKYISYNDIQSSSEFMFKQRIWSFDTLVKFNSLKFIYRGYNNLLTINIQYRLKKNTYNQDKFIRGISRISRNLFRVTNIGVSHCNYLPSNIINSPNLNFFTRLYKRFVFNEYLYFFIYFIFFTYFNFIIFYLVLSFTSYHVTIIYYFIKHGELEIMFRFIFLYFYIFTRLYKNP